MAAREICLTIKPTDFLQVGSQQGNVGVLQRRKQKYVDQTTHFCISRSLVTLQTAAVEGSRREYIWPNSVQGLLLRERQDVRGVVIEREKESK